MTERDTLISSRALFNSIGICGDAQTLGRLVGHHEDLLDCYYRIRFISGVRSDKCEETCWSAVGWFIPLRGVIPDDAYGFLEHVFCLNGCPPAAVFRATVAARDDVKMKTGGQGK